MYQALLTRRYLFSKVMPLLSALAVALCTAMVLIVWSVMGGFLATLLAQGRGMIGDVAVEVPYGRGGLAHYQDFIDRLAELPEVDAATPVIEVFGLMTLPTGDWKPVQVIGIEPEGYDRVTGYADKLYWRPLDEPLETDDERRDIRLAEDNAEVLARVLEHGTALAEPDPDTGTPQPAVVPGVMVMGNNRRTRAGFLEPYLFGPREEVSISVLALSRSGNVIAYEGSTMPVANEFRSGLYDADANWVYMPLAKLQEMVYFDESRRLAPDYDPGSLDPPRYEGTDPARVTLVLVRAAQGVTPERLEPAVERVYRELADDYPASEVPSPLTDGDMRDIYTWDKKPALAAFVAAVKNETVLVLVLFSFISLTAVFLIFAIFWSMVSEKTRDIGVLRALGASSAGVAWLYLRYGLLIGIAGSAIGGVIAWLVVSNINAIHAWMGSALGVEVWNPETYYFTEIPSDMDPARAALVLAGGVLFSVAGALLPALRAARMDPVRALRFE